MRQKGHKGGDAPLLWSGGAAGGRLPGELVSHRQICPKCLKVVWLTTRAEEQPLILLVISYSRRRRHKGGQQEVMEDKKNKKSHLRFHKSQDQLKLMRLSLDLHTGAA